jgi:hypothetical protein
MTQALHAHVNNKNTLKIKNNLKKMYCEYNNLFNNLLFMDQEMLKQRGKNRNVCLWLSKG